MERNNCIDLIRMFITQYILTDIPGCPLLNIFKLLRENRV